MQMVYERLFVGSESDCVGEVRIVPKCDSRVNWEHIDSALTPDETAVVMLNNNGTVAGVIHNIGN